MNKSELSIQMVKDSSLTKADALRVLDAFIDIVADELKKDDGKVTLVGFGTFKTTVRNTRKGRDPRTGKAITIPRRKAVKFVPGKQLKDLVK